MLADAGLAVVGGTSLFRLTRTAAAPDLFARLGRAGILVRIFPEADAATWLRFGLPPSEQAWQRLQIAMAGHRNTG
jgi:cobalamin biosynthetic protein CobC